MVFWCFQEDQKGTLGRKRLIKINQGWNFIKTGYFNQNSHNSIPKFKNEKPRVTLLGKREILWLISYEFSLNLQTKFTTIKGHNKWVKN